jgi:hypothetical protein
VVFQAWLAKAQVLCLDGQCPGLFGASNKQAGKIECPQPYLHRGACAIFEGFPAN